MYTVRCYSTKVTPKEIESFMYIYSTEIMLYLPFCPGLYTALSVCI